MNTSEIKPFSNCEALDGCHCQSSSLAIIFHNSRHPLSEEMLLGLGAVRSNVKNFFGGLGSRCGVEIVSKSTNSIKKARESLEEKLARPENIYTAIRQTLNDMLDPPISNMGIKGIRRTGKEMKKWPGIYDDETTRLILFNIYIFIDIEGTGGGCFRYMYSRFLKEASGITCKNDLLEVSEMIQESGKKFSDTGSLFKDIDETYNVGERIQIAEGKLNEIADLEEHAYQKLSKVIPNE